MSANETLTIVTVLSSTLQRMMVPMLRVLTFPLTTRVTMSGASRLKTILTNPYVGLTITHW